MIESVTETILSIVGQVSPFAYLLIFLGGIIFSLGPCNLSMVPVIIGYVGGQQDLTRRRAFSLSVFFTLGSTMTFVILGLIAAGIGGLFGPDSAILHWVVALVCFLIGLHLLGAIRLNFDLLARLQPRRVAVTGLLGALLLGLIVGLAGSQCATPILATIVTFAAKTGKLAYGASLLFVYGLGRGIPIILAGTFTSVVKALPALERWTRWMEQGAGVILVGIGLYFVWTA
jgi:cytochrome c-type biogenesis protein